ncbi:MAG: hypothetical protein ACIAQ0_12830 [Phycisphaerales bacterium JB058]
MKRKRASKVMAIWLGLLMLAVSILSVPTGLYFAILGFTGNFADASRMDNVLAGSVCLGIALFSPLAGLVLIWYGLE